MLLCEHSAVLTKRMYVAFIVDRPLHQRSHVVAIADRTIPRDIVFYYFEVKVESCSNDACVFIHLPGTDIDLGLSVGRVIDIGYDIRFPFACP